MYYLVSNRQQPSIEANFVEIFQIYMLQYKG